MLSGAGCSTESGIPDYRGPAREGPSRRPIFYKEFLGSESVRQRYWARSMHGFARFTAALPNPAHSALAELEAKGIVCGIITQNVDRLHHAAGSRRVVELHGALAEVKCLDCGEREPRSALQRRLLALNPGFGEGAVVPAPDGDAELPSELTRSFCVASCRACAGILKPDVVFFGENVPRATLEAAWSLFEEAELLLVVGSSLAVFSGYRFVREASRRGLPICIVNLGPTRGDSVADLRVEGRLGECLPRVAAALIGSRVGRA